MLKYLLGAGFLMFAAMPAHAQYAVGYTPPPQVGEIAANSPQPVNPLISAVPAREGARIAAQRAGLRNLYRVNKQCVTEYDQGNTESANQATDYRRAEAQAGTVIVLSGGICPASKRNQD